MLLLVREEDVKEAIARLELLVGRLEVALGRLEGLHGDGPPPNWTPEDAKKAQEAADKYVQSRKEALFNSQDDYDG